MSQRRWNTFAISALSAMTVMGTALPAFAQEDPLDAIRAAANGKGEMTDDTGKGDDGKGKGKPETPQPPTVPSTGPETWMAIAFVTGAGVLTLRMAGKTLSR